MESSKRQYGVIVSIVVLALLAVCAFVIFLASGDSKLYLNVSSKGIANNSGEVPLKIRAVDAYMPSKEVYSAEVTGSVTSDGRLKAEWQVPTQAKERPTFIEVCVATSDAGTVDIQSCGKVSGKSVNYDKVSCPYVVDANIVGRFARLTGWNTVGDTQKLGCESQETAFSAKSVLETVGAAIGGSGNEGIKFDTNGILVAKSGKLETTSYGDLINEVTKKIDQTSEVTYVTVSNASKGEKGSDGASGQDGKDGRDGQQGPVGPKGDDGVGGTITVDGGGLVLTGTVLRLSTCASGQILKSNGSIWSCGADIDTNTDTNTDQQVLNLAGNTLSISNGNAVDLSGYSQSIALNGTQLSISGGNTINLAGLDTDTNTTYSAGTGLNLTGTTFALSDTGVGPGSYNMVSVDTQGRVTSASMVNYLTSEQDGVVGNEISDVIAGSGLVRTGAGTATDPYKVGLLTACAPGQLMKWTGATWECANDTDTDTNTDQQTLSWNGATNILTIAGGNAVNLASLLDNTDNQVLSVNGDGASRVVAISGGNSIAVPDSDTLKDLSCSNNQIAKWNGTTWSCANDNDTDTNTTYGAGQGLVLSGTNFSLAQQGATNGQVLSWNGSAWVPTNTDQQTLSLAGANLTIANGNTVSLAGINTDNQALAWNTATRTLSLTNGGSVVIPQGSCNQVDTFCQNGNSFGTLATLGTNDSQALSFETNNTEAARITAAGDMGVGISVPQGRLHVGSNGGPTTGATAIIDRGGTGVTLLLRRANGTLAVPLAIPNSSGLGQFVQSGFDGSSWDTNAGIAVQGWSTQAWSPTEKGSRINFWVTPDSTTTRVMKMILGSNGYLGLADYTTVGGNPMTHRLHVNESDATKDPVRFEGVRLESGSSNDLVTIDASGVLKRRSFSVGSSAVFTAPSAASTGTQTVTFGSPKANTNYNTQCTVTGLLGYCAITNKTVNGFTITWYAQASGSGSADWQASGGN